MRSLADMAPPASIEFEQCCLGAMLISTNALETVTAGCSRGDFYNEGHRRIWDSITSLHGENRPVDVMTVTEELRHRGQLEQIGGSAYIHTLTETIPTAAHASDYAREVRRTGTWRRLVEAGERFTQAAYEADGDPERAIARMEQDLLACQLWQDDRRGFRTAGELTPGILKRFMEDETTRGVSTGWRSLDNLTNGWQAGSLIVIGGLPGMGKTSITVGTTLASAKAGNSTGVVSLEMDAENLLARYWASESSVPIDTIIRKQGTDEQKREIHRAAGRVGDLPLHFNDWSETQLTEMRGQSRRLHRKHGLKLIVVDFLQRVFSPKEMDSENAWLTVVSRGLKSMARELEVPVIALASLNRQAGKDNRKPQLSDLRGSGSIESEADLVIFLWREDYRNVENPQPESVIELHVSKNRQGALGNVKLLFQKPYSRFTEIDTYHEPPPAMEERSWPY